MSKKVRKDSVVWQRRGGPWLLRGLGLGLVLLGAAAGWALARLGGGLLALVVGGSLLYLGVMLLDVYWRISIEGETLSIQHGWTTTTVALDEVDLLFAPRRNSWSLGLGGECLDTIEIRLPDHPPLIEALRKRGVPTSEDPAL